MARRLRRGVILDGDLIPAGTPETPYLAAEITNPRAWVGEPDAPAPAATPPASPPLPPAPSSTPPTSGQEQHSDDAPAKGAEGADESGGPDEAEDADEADGGEGDEPEQPATPASREPTPQEPPRSGKGSGVHAWQAYATHLGVQFPAEATRDELIQLVDAHQK